MAGVCVKVGLAARQCALLLLNCLLLCMHCRFHLTFLRHRPTHRIDTATRTRFEVGEQQAEPLYIQDEDTSTHIIPFGITLHVCTGKGGSGAVGLPVTLRAALSHAHFPTFLLPLAPADRWTTRIYYLPTCTLCGKCAYRRRAYLSRCSLGYRSPSCFLTSEYVRTRQMAPTSHPVWPPANPRTCVLVGELGQNDATYYCRCRLHSAPPLASEFYEKFV